MSTSNPAQLAHPLEYAAAAAAAQRHQADLLTAAPWIRDELGQRCQRIVAENASGKSKLVKLRQLADQLAEAIAPHSACRRGCAHCCRSMVALAHSEAEWIGKAIGRPLSGNGRSAREASWNRGIDSTRYWGVPCPFLAGEECGIHPHRPIACRLNFSMADSFFFCRTELKPEESTVPQVQLGIFWHAYAYVTQHDRQGDIREFFA